MKHFEFVKQTRLQCSGNTYRAIEREWRHIKTGIILIERVDHVRYNSWWYTWHRWTDRQRQGAASLKYWVKHYQLGAKNVQQNQG